MQLLFYWWLLAWLASTLKMEAVNSAGEWVDYRTTRYNTLQVYDPLGFIARQYNLAYILTTYFLKGHFDAVLLSTTHYV
jgi:hypothetical protein